MLPDINTKSKSSFWDAPLPAFAGTFPSVRPLDIVPYLPCHYRRRRLTTREARMFHTSPKLTSGPPRIASPGRAFYGQLAVLGSRNTEKDLHWPTYRDRSRISISITSGLLTTQDLPLRLRKQRNSFLSLGRNGGESAHRPRIHPKLMFPTSAVDRLKVKAAYATRQPCSKSAHEEILSHCAAPPLVLGAACLLHFGSFDHPWCTGANT